MKIIELTFTDGTTKVLKTTGAVDLDGDVVRLHHATGFHSIIGVCTYRSLTL